MRAHRGRIDQSDHVGVASELRATFPRVSADAQQVIVSGTPANEVTVKLCWKNGESDTPHTLEVSNRVQWQ